MELTTIEQKIAANAYTNRDEFPIRLRKPTISKDACSADYSRYAVELAAWEKEESERKEKVRSWKLKDSDLGKNFGKDVVDYLVDFGFSGNQAKTIFYRAWEEGHSSGYSEVLNCVVELENFAKELLKG